MRYLASVLSVAAGVLLLSGPVSAAGVGDYFITTLLGSNEVGGNPSPATGSATLTVLAPDSFRLDLIVTGLQGTGISGAHIHSGVPGVNGPVVVDLQNTSLLTGNPADFVHPSFSFSHVYTDTNDVRVANMIAALGDLTHYINIHTNGVGGTPGGEIRGNFAAAPEPGTIALMGLGGLAAVGIVRRRRRS